MSDLHVLPSLLERTARRRPERTAVVEPGEGKISYQELSRLSDLLRDRLVQLGVRPGDRVGIYMRKSIDAVAAIFGILKAGAAYIPCDPHAPVARNAFILNDCSVRAVVLESRFQEPLQKELSQRDGLPVLFRLGGTGGGRSLAAALSSAGWGEPDPDAEAIISGPDDLAYILYTSGSTGQPKGVMISHRNALSFVDWCSEAFLPREDDRFSSHAPFHFDLSIFDLYVSIKHGATLVLIGTEIGKEPGGLAGLIADERISVWYSTPSILSLLARYGKLSRYDYSALRLVIFAGEVFPVKHLRALKALLPRPRYFNLYGPTETNVCTYYEIPNHIAPERTEPFPIGKGCSHYEIKVVDDRGQTVLPGHEGQLVAGGAGVMLGYWNLPERTHSALLYDSAGKRWYRTGDIVIEESDGNYRYVSRCDRMVKRRGYRIELGEIEMALYRHPSVKEAAVVSKPDEESGVRIVAALCCPDDQKPSLIELKRFCMENLPGYMIPDQFVICDTLPKTSTAKKDYQALIGAL